MVNTSKVGTKSPSPERIKRLLKDYGLPRWKAARMIERAQITLNRYLLPISSRHHHNMPQHRWKLLLGQIKAWRHPNRDVVLTL